MTGKEPERWNRVYSGYGGARFSVWGDGATPFFLSKIGFLKKFNVKKVLDAGCGDGRNLLAFSEAGFEMLGVDSSSEAIGRARRLCRDCDGVSLKEIDLLELDSNEEFDAVICDYLVVHMEEPKRLVGNLYKALKKGGFLLIEFLSTDDPSFGKGKTVGENSFVDRGIFHRFYSTEEAKALLGKFEILETEKMRHSDPDHVEDYPRPGKHLHDSIYILARKK